MKNQLEDGEKNSNSISMVNFYKSEISLLKDQNSFLKSKLQQKQIIVEKRLVLQKDQSKINCSNKLHNKHDNSRPNFGNTHTSIKIKQLKIKAWKPRSLK